MAEYTVEWHGEVRELYSVEADSVEEARQKWSDSEPYLTEAMGGEIYSITEDE